MKHNALLIILLALSLPPLVKAQAEVDFREQRKVAVLVAVDRYAASDLEPLSSGVERARILGRLLEEQGYFVHYLLGTYATRSRIMQAADDAVSRVGNGPGQMILFSQDTRSRIQGDSILPRTTLGYRR
jgi:hypothetical protein